MKKFKLLFSALFFVFIGAAQAPIKFHTIQGLTILGRPFPTQTTYRRFPDSLQSLLRKPVWQLSNNSTGIAIYFESNAYKSTPFTSVAATCGNWTDAPVFHFALICVELDSK